MRKDSVWLHLCGPPCSLPVPPGHQTIMFDCHCSLPLFPTARPSADPVVGRAAPPRRTPVQHLEGAQHPLTVLGRSARNLAQNDYFATTGTTRLTIDVAPLDGGVQFQPEVMLDGGGDSLTICGPGSL